MGRKLSGRKVAQPHGGALTPFGPNNRAKGRPRGAPNRTTRILKEAALEAAALVGENGRGTDGRVGYLRRCAVRHPREYLVLLGKILPVQIAAAVDRQVVTRDMTPDEAAQIYFETVRQITGPPVIDAAPVGPSR